MRRWWRAQPRYIDRNLCTRRASPADRRRVCLKTGFDDQRQFDRCIIETHPLDASRIRCNCNAARRQLRRISAPGGPGYIARAAPQRIGGFRGRLDAVHQRKNARAHRTGQGRFQNRPPQSPRRASPSTRPLGGLKRALDIFVFGLQRLEFRSRSLRARIAEASADGAIGPAGAEVRTSSPAATSASGSTNRAGCRCRHCARREIARLRENAFRR